MGLCTLSDLPPRYPHRHASLDVNPLGMRDVLRGFSGHAGAQVAKVSTCCKVHPGMRRRALTTRFCSGDEPRWGLVYMCV